MNLVQRVYEKWRKKRIHLMTSYSSCRKYTLCSRVKSSRFSHQTGLDSNPASIPWSRPLYHSEPHCLISERKIVSPSEGCWARQREGVGGAGQSTSKHRTVLSYSRMPPGVLVPKTTNLTTFSRTSSHTPSCPHLPLLRTLRIAKDHLKALCKEQSTKMLK